MHTSHAFFIFFSLINFTAALGMKYPRTRNKQERDYRLQEKQYEDRIQALRCAIYLDSVEDYIKFSSKRTGQKIKRADMVRLFGEAIARKACNIVQHAAHNSRLKNKYLYEAVERGSFDTIKLLIANGANIHYKPDMYLSSIEILVHRGNLALADYFLEKGAVLPKFTTIHTIRGDNYEMDRIHYLIRFYRISPAQMRWLLDHGHDPEEQDQGRPLLYSTQDTNHIEVLCDAGANPNVSYNSFGSRLVLIGETTISFKNTLENSIILLAAGADIDVTESFRGQTALHIAAKHTMTDLVAFLLHKGARKDIQDKQRHTAFDLAKDPAIKEMLWADIRPPLPHAALPMLERIQKKKIKIA